MAKRVERAERDQFEGHEMGVTQRAVRRSSVRAVPVAIEYWRQQRRRCISSALSHSGSCTWSMKRHLSPQLPHTTDLPSGSARPLKVRLNSLTSERCFVCWQVLMRRLSTPERRQRCVEVSAALRTEVKIPPGSIVVAPAEVKGAFWAAQCVTDRGAEGYEYAEDHEKHRHLERGVVVKVEIDECLETESAGESEQDEVAAGAQELLAGRRCLHVRKHYRPRGGAGRCQRSCVRDHTLEPCRGGWRLAPAADKAHATNG